VCRQNIFKNSRYKIKKKKNKTPHHVRGMFAKLLVVYVVALVVLLYFGFNDKKEDFAAASPASQTICDNKGRCASTTPILPKPNVAFDNVEVKTLLCLDGAGGKACMTNNDLKRIKNGSTGTRGQAGPAGPAGPRGLTGPPGPSGTGGGSSANNTKVTTQKLQLGHKFLMSGVGDAHANDNWLRMFGTDEKGYYGGFAAGKLWTPEFHSEGGGNNFKGGSSRHNPGKWQTHFPWAGNNQNYIRGDTELRGDLNNLGNINVGENLNVTGKMHFRDPSMSTTPNGPNNSDPYSIEKVTPGGNNSHLRLSINDDADESLQIWGDSCRAGNCAGPGVMRHRFGADGTAVHTNTLTVNKENGWGTSINVNAPVQPESLYALHFGDGKDIHGRQAGMGYVANQPNKIYGSRGTLASHIHEADDFMMYSSGWNPLFAIKGGSGDAYVRGRIKSNQVQLGNKFLMSGVGDAHANDDWLRLFNPGNSGYYGGFAAGRLWTAQGALAGSDKRMKNNIRSLNETDDSNFKLLKAKKFNWKEDKENKKRDVYGFIAQEVEKTHPDMVQKGANGMMSINYNEFVPLVVDQVQQVQKQVQKDKLCIDDVCITKDELKALKSKAKAA